MSALARLGFKLSVRLRAAASRASVDLTIDRTVAVERRVRVSIDRDSRTIMRLVDGCSIGAGALLRLSGGTLDLEGQSRLGRHSFVETSGGQITLRRSAATGEGCVLRAAGGEIELGEDTRLADHVVVHAAPARAVRVGRGARVGTDAVLMPGAQVPPKATVPPRATIDEPPAQRETTSR